MNLKILLNTGIALLIISMLVSCSNVQIVNLKTEFQTTPLGIDQHIPRFSWQMVGKNKKTRGLNQEAYSIIVKEESGKIVWNSGIVKTDESLNILYSGDSLKPCTRYNWRVIVWDNQGNTTASGSWFETGFLNNSMKAWGSAKWIGGANNNFTFGSWLSLGV